MNSSDTPVSLQDSPDNHGAVVNIVSWFLLVFSSLLILTRLGTKWAVSRVLHVDDGMIVLSLILCISQTIATNLAVANGLGRHIDTLSDENVIAFQKCFYAANVLFISSQATSKLSVIFFIRVISPYTLHRHLTTILIAATLLWTLTSTLLLLFQCDVSRVWDSLSNQCMDERAMWNFINTVNLLIDVGLVCLPVMVVLKLRVKLQRKIAVVSCFGTRILTIAAIIWQMINSQQIPNHQDATFSYWSLVLSMSLAENLGIMTACAPYLKPLLDSLESGLIRSDDIRRRAKSMGKSTADNSGGQDQSQGNSSASAASRSRSIAHGVSHELQDLGNPNSAVTASVTAGGAGGHGNWETASQSSQGKLIKQVKTWGVTSS